MNQKRSDERIGSNAQDKLNEMNENKLIRLSYLFDSSIYLPNYLRTRFMVADERNNIYICVTFVTTTLDCNQIRVNFSKKNKYYSIKTIRSYVTTDLMLFFFCGRKIYSDK